MLPAEGLTGAVEEVGAVLLDVGGDVDGDMVGTGEDVDDEEDEEEQEEEDETEAGNTHDCGEEALNGTMRTCICVVL